MADHPRPEDLGHGYGETLEQHRAHTVHPPVRHWGLSEQGEKALFYCFAVSSWCLEIVASVMGSYYSPHDHRFIATVTPFLFLSWAAWWQTVVGMMQRASWVRDESNLPDRRRYLYFAVRLNQLMWVRVSWCCLFTELAERDRFQFNKHSKGKNFANRSTLAANMRHSLRDFPSRLRAEEGRTRRYQLAPLPPRGTFLLNPPSPLDLPQVLTGFPQFILNIVGSVMNAYNNITWESDRLEYEEGHPPYGNKLLLILGIPTAPQKGEILSVPAVCAF